MEFFYIILLTIIGSFLGTIIGIIPGLGPTAVITVLLPIAYYFDPLHAIALYSSIYFGTQYSGSTTAIVLGIPGESSSVTTAGIGHRLAKKNFAVLAINAVGLSSVIGAIIAIIFLFIFSPFLSEIALRFGPMQMLMLLIIALLISIKVTDKKLIISVGSILIGSILGSVGTDLTSGEPRLIFGSLLLLDGLDFVVVSMAFYCFSSLMLEISPLTSNLKNVKFRFLFPIKKIYKSILIGSGIGILFGMLPGINPIITAVTAFNTRTKKLQKIVAGEAANNATSQINFVALFALGIPFTSAMYLIYGALTITGVRLGPMFLHEQTSLFTNMVLIMLLSNLILYIMNTLFNNLSLQVLNIPKYYIYPGIFIIVFCIMATMYSTTDIFIVLTILTLIAILCEILNFESHLIFLGFVIGPQIFELSQRVLTMTIMFDNTLTALSIVIVIIILWLAKSKKQITN